MEINEVVPTENAPADPLNMRVAVTVAILATFMGICKIKDDNICQAMQQAQANKIDHWNYYQARNIREEIAKSTIAQLKLAAIGRPAAEQQGYQDAMKKYEDLAAEQKKKKEDEKSAAEQSQKDYDDANFRDDQFDLSDAALAIAISLLAVTTLTRQRWLFIGAMIPVAFGLAMGVAGLCGLSLHPSGLIALLS